MVTRMRITTTNIIRRNWGTFNSCNFYSKRRVDELLDNARAETDWETRLGCTYAEVQEILSTKR